MFQTTLHCDLFRVLSHFLIISHFFKIYDKIKPSLNFNFFLYLVSFLFVFKEIFRVVQHTWKDVENFLLHEFHSFKDFGILFQFLKGGLMFLSSE